MNPSPESNGEAGAILVAPNSLNTSPVKQPIPGDELVDGVEVILVSDATGLIPPPLEPSVQSIKNGEIAHASGASSSHANQEVYPDSS